MKIIKARIFEKFSEIKFGFSTKIGSGENRRFSFNMSFSVGDENDVIKNRKAFLTELGIKPENLAWQKQIHSDVIRIVEKPGFQGESDALVTDKKEIALGVFSADCTTIYVFDNANKIIAAIHSGWRGTEKRILPKTLKLLYEKFGSQPKNLFAFIAPAISQKNYEVGAEVAARFNGKYLEPNSNGKFLLDVSAVNYDYLLEFGLPSENVEKSELCSYENEFLHSYRRDAELSGRAMGVICLSQ